MYSEHDYKVIDVIHVRYGTGISSPTLPNTHVLLLYCAINLCIVAEVEVEST